MKNISFLGAVLSGALAAAPVMAEDSAGAFHALSQMPSGLSAMPEAQLASIQGGQNTNQCVSSAAGGLLTLVAANALNCSNTAVIVPVNACVNVLIGVCGAQSNTVNLTQSVQSILVDPGKK